MRVRLPSRHQPENTAVQIVERRGYGAQVGPLGGLRVVTDTHDPVQTLQESLKVDFAIEDDRFEYHEVLAGLFSHWLSERTSNAVSDALATTSLVWSRSRSFGQAIDALHRFGRQSDDCRLPG